ncbi:sigma-70 family RNA polymerase sigma factor [Sphingobium boeckii]|nr:sigma-70 family RNA polymerase sigma factor [Sphingobium boeckii]
MTIPQSRQADLARTKLVEALACVGRQETDALRQVYDLTSAKLFGICLRISQDREGAEDILQEVYVSIWNRAASFDPARSSPITWMCTIARNRAIDWRRAQRLPDAPIEDAALKMADIRPRAPEIMLAAENRKQLHDCLDALENRQNAAIRSAFLDGLTYAELAARASVPAGTMKSWIRRGLMRLKECLERD